jgi:beta-barrel assembly-enhancing protease
MAVACQSTGVAPIDTTRQPLALEPDERRLWDEAQRAERRIEDAGLVYSNADLEVYIESVAVRLTGQRLGSSGPEVKVRVLRIPYREAFVFPNGVFYITTGMLACLDNEAELAVVLGHETTHFIRRHALMESRSAANKEVWVNIFAGTTGAVGLSPVVRAIGYTWATSAILGYSRDLESEADEQGLEELVRAGYDPAPSVQVFEYLRQEDELEETRFSTQSSTHPQAQDRIQHYRELLATQYAAMANEPGRRINREQYLARVRSVLLDNAALDIAIGRLEFAQFAVDKHITRWPYSAPGYFYLGEIWRRRHVSGALLQAETAYREGARLDPGYAEPHRELGLLYRVDGRLYEARDEFAMYVALDPTAIDARIFQGYLCELDAELAGPATP